MKKNKSCGKVYLVGAGPGDPELLTVKAQRLIQSARVLLHDDLVPAAVLNLAPATCQVSNVGKRFGSKGVTQQEINQKMIDCARDGFDVVRLQSGDPAIFGRLAEETDALDAAGVPFEIIPGITAALGAAASRGVSLTDRRKSARIVIVTNHQAHGEQRDIQTDWKALAREDATLVIYMPGHNFQSLQMELIGAGLPPTIPVMIVSHATTPQERHHADKLENLHTAPNYESPAVVLVGWSLERAMREPNIEASVAVREAEALLSSL